ncbi:MAG: type II toxin-antitoxin system VapC family toxin [Acidipropionibacterium sp.]|jgi:predicted nucleic acid-binding protein|nr:type II toxin-antitoxin system VapC family toxin [Acidipropionibacterium sp.]
MSVLTAFDADVLIYAATQNHPLSVRVRTLFTDSADIEGDAAGIGSVLLLAEVLPKPLRADPDSDEVAALISLLSRIDLQPVDVPTVRLAVALATSYGLHAADAVHLATAVAGGADRFVTNNRKDFPLSISEVEITYPEMLPSTSA